VELVFDRGGAGQPATEPAGARLLSAIRKSRTGRGAVARQAEMRLRGAVLEPVAGDDLDGLLAAANER
jgi:hypothetical protein